MKRIAIKTIGCKLNQYDSQSIAEPFLAEGYEWVQFSDPADVYIINSCTVTSRADYSSRQAVSRAVRAVNSNGSGDAVVVLTGCYAEVQEEQLKDELGVDLVVGNRRKANIFREVAEHLGEVGRANAGSPTIEYDQHWGKAITGMKGYSRAFIKIQDGCNSSCTYCIVPRARGDEVSRTPEDIFAEIRRLEDAGFHEVVLTGVHIGRYRHEGYRLHNLLNDILAGDGPRIRFSSLEPNEVDNNLISAIAGKKRFCQHIHIPVQSGSDRILKLMKRGYTAEKIRQISALLTNSLPEITLGADFIVGFPDENDEDFCRSVELASECGFGYLHVFSYSDRPGTAASEMPAKIAPEVKSSRSKILRELSKELLNDNLERTVGNTGEIIVESRKHRETGLNTGVSGNYLRCVFSGNSVAHGQIQKLRYMSVAGEGKYRYLVGEKIND